MVKLVARARPGPDDRAADRRIGGPGWRCYPKVALIVIELPVEAEPP